MFINTVVGHEFLYLDQVITNVTRQTVEWFQLLLRVLHESNRAVAASYTLEDSKVEQSGTYQTYEQKQ